VSASQRSRQTSRVQRQFYANAYAADRPGRVPSRLWRVVSRFELHLTDAVMRLVAGGEWLLDVGCGNGRLVVQAATRFRNVVGLDISADQLDAARGAVRDSGQRACFVLGNADTGLPFSDAQFDAVTAVAVLAMTFDPIFIVRELRRVLKSGGSLIIEVPNLAYLPRRLALLTGKLPRVSDGYGWDGGHLHNFTEGAVRELLHAGGFRVELSSGSGVLAAPRAVWPSLLTGNLIVLARKT
jgi:SAM-dependent methyltransferase